MHPARLAHRAQERLTRMDAGTSPPSLLHAVIESAPTALILSDSSGRIVLANQEAERLFGYSRRELRGLQVESLMPERFRMRHPDLRGGYQEAPSARRMGSGRDLRGLRRDGTEFPIEIGLSPVTTEHGVFILSAAVDISERLRSERNFRQALESSPIAKLIVDAQGRIDFANDEAARLFGYERSALTGKQVEILLPPDERDLHPRLRAGYMANPHPRRMGAGRMLHGLRSDGSTVPVEIGLSTLDTPSGPLVLAAIMDISERVRAEKAHRKHHEELERRVAERTTALAESNAALARSNEDLQQFAYIASHDLQTPLRGIAGCAQLLERSFGEDADPELRDLTRRMVNSTITLQMMIRDLLAYSRIDAHQDSITEVSLEDALADACNLLDAVIAESGARIDKAALPAVPGERTQLVQLFANLLGNAIKYRSRELPLVRVSAQDIGAQVQVSVADNGIGIAQEHQHRIFEIFKRLHNQQAYPGTGIGLAVCRRVVQRHGGHIWVESQPGVGSVFHFTLNKSLSP